VGLSLMMRKQLCVCYFGTYRDQYARNQIMIEGLRRNGVKVIECHEQLWHGTEDRVQVASGGWLRPAFWWRVTRTYLRLLWRYRHAEDYDVMVVAYPGQLDVFLARVLTWLRRKPLAWDILMSLYLILLERELSAQGQLASRLVHRLEKIACHLPDLLIVQTAASANWFHANYGIPPDRCYLVPIGADDRIFEPAYTEETGSDVFRVLYYGSFIPNHGVQYIVQAARLLADDKTISFELVGAGPDRSKAIELARQYALANVIFTDWLEKQALGLRIARADVCLGIFGVTPQSLMTLHNKVFEGLAMAKPVITGDSPAIREFLTHGEHVYLCERANPRALAEAIRALHGDVALRRRLAQQGHAAFVAGGYGLAGLGQRMRTALDDLIATKANQSGA
jgi:glycosyltransferase involved in cell wall biosynthesis